MKLVSVYVDGAQIFIPHAEIEQVKLPSQSPHDEGYILLKSGRMVWLQGVGAAARVVKELQDATD